MSLLLLYFTMLKATVLSLNGQSSLPIVREDFVVNRKVLTDRQLNAAVTVAQSSPGPMGGYVVSVGYFVRGVPGALVCWLALITPAAFVVPILRFAAKRIHDPRVQSSLDAIVIAGSGLVVSTAFPMAVESGVLRGAFPAAIAAVSFGLVTFTRVPTVAVILLGGLATALIAG